MRSVVVGGGELALGGLHIGPGLVSGGLGVPNGAGPTPPRRRRGSGSGGDPYRTLLDEEREWLRWARGLDLGHDDDDDDDDARADRVVEMTVAELEARISEGYARGAEAGAAEVEALGRAITVRTGRPRPRTRGEVVAGALADGRMSDGARAGLLLGVGLVAIAIAAAMA